MGLCCCFAMGMGREQRESCCLLPVVPEQPQADPKLEADGAVLVQTRAAGSSWGQQLGSVLCRRWSAPVLFQPSHVPPAPSPRAPAHSLGSWPACSLFSLGPCMLRVPLAGVTIAFPWLLSVGPVGCWRDHGAILPHRAAPGTRGPPAMVPAGTAWPQASRAGQLCREHVSSGKMQLLAATAAVQLVGMSSPRGAAGLGTGWGTSWELCSVPLSGKTGCCIPSHQSSSSPCKTRCNDPCNLSAVGGQDPQSALRTCPKAAGDTPCRSSWGKCSNAWFVGLYFGPDEAHPNLGTGGSGAHWGPKAHGGHGAEGRAQG